jgi:hypothetical protein
VLLPTFKSSPSFNIIELGGIILSVTFFSKFYSFFLFLSLKLKKNAGLHETVDFDLIGSSTFFSKYISFYSNGVCIIGDKFSF